MALRLLLILTSDALLAVVALFLALLMRFGAAFVSATDLHGDNGAKVFAIFVGVMLFSSYLMEVYSLARESSKREIFITCLQGGGAGFFLLSVVYYLDPSVMLGRGVLFIALGLFIIFQSLWHWFSDSGAGKTPFAPRVLILGTGEVASKLGEILSSGSSYVLAGYVDCDETAVLPDGESKSLHLQNIVKKEGDLLQTARAYRAGIIVVALAERRGVLPLQEMMRCKLNGVEILDAPTFYEMVQGKLMLEQMTPGWIIFSSGFRRTALISIYKRGFDILLSLVGLTITVPFFPFIALAIRVESPGPVFFRQIRVGSGEKPFMLYKFRSMAKDAEKNGAVWAVKNDARVTRVGRFLRNSRIDELPQLYNVLKGDMSFIGPRPERPEFVESLKREIYYYSKRHSIKPGLTGWAQVRYPYGSSVEDAVEKLRYDLYYIKNLSVFLDSQIMLETVKVVLFGRGR